MTIQIADRCVVQVITIAKFARPANPRRCNFHRYHVWRWRGGPHAPAGLTCQCGCLSDPPPCPLLGLDDDA